MLDGSDRDAWRQGAQCRDYPRALFFSSDAATTERAKVVCAVCPVRAACLAYALADTGSAGVWGATTEHEREQLRRTRQRAETQ